MNTDLHPKIDNEYAAIAARITLAVDLIEGGEAGKAAVLLRNLQCILPTPTAHNLKSARMGISKPLITNMGVGHG